MLYPVHYCNTHDYFFTGIKERFDQPNFKLHSQMQNLLSKSRNNLVYEEKDNIVGEVILMLLP